MPVSTGDRQEIIVNVTDSNGQGISVFDDMFAFAFILGFRGAEIVTDNLQASRVWKTEVREDSGTVLQPSETVLPQSETVLQQTEDVRHLAIL